MALKQHRATRGVIRWQEIAGELSVKQPDKGCSERSASTNDFY